MKQSEKHDWKKPIEDFIEKKNAIIQIVFFLFWLLVCGLSVCQKQDALAIIIQLLFLISAEMIIANIKDSITQRKLNDLLVREDIKNGKLFRVANFDITPFFDRSQKDLLVSGIANNYFMNRLKTNIIEHLVNGKKMYIIIAAPETVPECAKLYFGMKSLNVSEENIKSIYNKQLETLACIKNNSILYQAFLNKQLRIFTAYNVISTSFVAYDIIESGIKNNTFKEIKASFYQYSCTNDEDEPNILVNSNDSKNWYEILKRAIKTQINDAYELDGAADLDKLIEDIKCGII